MQAKEVHIGGPKPAARSPFAINVKAILAAAEDGDGILTEEEKQLCETLRACDTDGDGELELHEIVNMGKAKLKDQTKIARLKKLVVLVVLLSLVFCGVMLGLMMLANETSKDSKPEKTGKLKTIAGESVGTAVSQDSGSLDQLLTLSQAQLQTVTSLAVSFPDPAAGFEVFHITHASMERNEANPEKTRLSLSTGDQKLIVITAGQIQVFNGPTSSDNPAVRRTRHLRRLQGVTEEEEPAELWNRALRFEKPLQFVRDAAHHRRMLLSEPDTTDKFVSTDSTANPAAKPAEGASMTRVDPEPVCKVGDQVTVKGYLQQANGNKGNQGLELATGSIVSMDGTIGITFSDGSGPAYVKEDEVALSLSGKSCLTGAI